MKTSKQKDNLKQFVGKALTEKQTQYIVGGTEDPLTSRGTEVTVEDGPG